MLRGLFFGGLRRVRPDQFTKYKAKRVAHKASLLCGLFFVSDLRTMKYILVFVAIATVFACKPKASSETVSESTPAVQHVDTLSANPSVQTPPDNISATSGTSAAMDSITATPPDPGNISHTGPGGKKYETPKTNPKPTDHKCEPNINLLAKPKGNVHFYYITGFNNAEFECWIGLERHGVEICQNKVCTIYYLDKPQVNIASGANPIDAATLKAHGIGMFKHDGSFWELNGAHIWKRSPGYGYFNTNNHLGG
jgi:hypothetical protein